MLLCEKEKCTGCMACFNTCPQNAIKIIENEQGFLEPEIDEAKCINCKKCNHICPILNIPDRAKTGEEVYAIWTKDEKLRFSSTSGGFFTQISNYVLSKNGVVFGAAFDKDFKVIHTEAKTEEELEKMRGSKYVQSDLSPIYPKIKQYLEERRLVLVTGTSCQIAAMNSFFKDQYDHLITMDVVCHGVPSPKMFEEYKRYMEKKYQSEIKDIKFRYKKPGWEVFSMRIEFESGKIYIASTHQDPYIRGFLREIYLRNCCSDCQFTNLQRQGDFTCSDFWGYRSTTIEDLDNDKGISMVMTNTNKAKEILNQIRPEVQCYVRNVKEAVKGNRCLSRSYEASPKKDVFWKDYHENGFEYVMKQYLYPEKISLKTKIKHLSKKILGYKTYFYIKKLYHHIKK